MASSEEAEILADVAIRKANGISAKMSDRKSEEKNSPSFFSETKKDGAPSPKRGPLVAPCAGLGQTATLVELRSLRGSKVGHPPTPPPCRDVRRLVPATLCRDSLDLHIRLVELGAFLDNPLEFLCVCDA